MIDRLETFSNYVCNFNKFTHYFPIICCKTRNYFSNECGYMRKINGKDGNRAEVERKRGRRRLEAFRLALSVECIAIALGFESFFNRFLSVCQTLSFSLTFSLSFSNFNFHFQFQFLSISDEESRIGQWNVNKSECGVVHFRFRSRFMGICFSIEEQNRLSVSDSNSKPKSAGMNDDLVCSFVFSIFIVDRLITMLWTTINQRLT